MLGISYAEAEGIKVGMPAEVEQHLEGLIIPLGRELRASIDFYEHQNEKTVNRAYLTGGSARSTVHRRTVAVPPDAGVQCPEPDEFSGARAQAATNG